MRPIREVRMEPNSKNCSKKKLTLCTSLLLVGGQLHHQPALTLAIRAVRLLALRSRWGARTEKAGAVLCRHFSIFGSRVHVSYKSAAQQLRGGAAAVRPLRCSDRERAQPPVGRHVAIKEMNARSLESSTLARLQQQQQPHLLTFFLSALLRCSLLATQPTRSNSGGG